jgi:hypothetical protein
MSNIIDVRVDLYEDRINMIPRILVLVDADEHTQIEYEERDYMYLGIKDDIASFYYYDRPGDGFGGMRIPIKMKDGTERVLEGPWSSNSASVNGLFPETPVVECSITYDKNGWNDEHIYSAHGGAALISSLIPKLKEKGIRCGMVNTGYGVYFRPLSASGQSKDPRDIIIKEF